MFGLRPLTGKWSGSTRVDIFIEAVEYWSPSPYGEMVGVDFRANSQ